MASIESKNVDDPDEVRTPASTYINPYTWTASGPRCTSLNDGLGIEAGTGIRAYGASTAALANERGR
jgi:hypothetical protein